MAHDYRFYIRAGAHTVKARQFIVEAIWSKRYFQKPRIAHVFRPKPQNEQVIQLGVVALTNAPALDVRIRLEPLGENFRQCPQYFPLQIPVVNSLNPFYIDVTTDFKGEAMFGTNVHVIAEYRDLAGSEYTYDEPVSISNAIPLFGLVKTGLLVGQNLSSRSINS
ncbi:hypothetical protein KOR42_07370 [Thalassoglobus neptunius]|uniref:Uncharacterized protein n=1 Tax=Thalassoglobus neptunius TaxID=1938619 RepID=A0A5C5X2U3_9PLAN|nr:hypothetical protein [Thalassoglobus neptunius]TWT57377.1 hypothetical protein KOR42_07370 [Thalassoglobus neptunius]